MASPSPAPLRLGVLGAANIARQFIRDAKPSPAISIEAVASRDAGKAKKFAEETGVPRHHASYEALLADPSIEAVYIPLPNTLHAPWAIRAAEAGKHVLCEKPIAMGLNEARAMFAAARKHKVLLHESYPYWFQPQIADMMTLIEGGEDSTIGRIRLIQTCFGFNLQRNPGNIRLTPEVGGGALYDAGTYPLSFIRLVMGRAPLRVVADATWDSTGVDIATAATLHYIDGARAQMSTLMDGAWHRFATIVGSKGLIETDYLNHTTESGVNEYGYMPSLMRVRRGTAGNVPFEEIKSAIGSGFRLGAEFFAGMVRRNDVALMEHYAAISCDNAATLEAIAISMRAGRPVALAEIG